ncbi:uncharacterized protein K02A2.6-like [Rhopilema esculentum]|uniref:uncharacterized protein K02A2.6-like n=1 Tax=Rhopilema esculentum TaxID=499914 RepID=UPI0031DDEE3C
MASALVGLKACVTEFNPDVQQDAGSNQERRWKLWLENLELVMDFEGITDAAEGPSKRRAALLAVGGSELRELFATLTVADAKYSTATAALTAHFTAKKNLAAERYKFFCTKPTSPEESHDHWATRLRIKGADCEFNEMDLNSAITLVMTLHTHSEKLQREIIAQDMDLKKVLATARSIELTNREIAFMKQHNMEATATPTPVYAVQGKHPKAEHLYKSKGKTIEICRYCGERTPHKGKCKAMGATCKSCNKKNHFASVCESRKSTKPVKTVDTEEKFDENPEQDSYIYNNFVEGPTVLKLDAVTTPVHAIQSKKRYPDTMVQVKFDGGTKLRMQIDTGADANIIDESLYHQLHPKPKLRRTQVKLKPYNSPPIPVKGSFQTQLTANGKQAIATVYVVPGSGQKPLIGKYTAFDLSLLSITVKELTADMQDMHHVLQERKQGNKSAKATTHVTQHMSYSAMAEHLTSKKSSEQRLDNIYKHKQDATDRVKAIVDQYPGVFEGIGKHRYRVVKLSVDKSVPPKIQPQRRIPFAKREQFEAILKELEDADIIEPVYGPTEWVSNVVLTPKADPSQLRMSLDMTTANTAIRRTRHVIPTLEELRYKLNGAKHFTKLDMRQGYMQFELSPESRYMTTFYTHQGLRRFKRLNFGTNSAAEIFNEEIRQTLVDIEHVENIYDDIIVFGKSQKEHDRALMQVLQRLEDCGLTLGMSKCSFNQPEIKFFGMTFSSAGMSPSPDKVQALHDAQPPASAAEVRSFLGMANFSAHFIRNYSALTTPLRLLTRKNVTFNWTNDCQKAFQSIKEALSQDTTMAYFDPTRETKLIVDGSKYGLSSILTQLEPQTQQYKVIRYDSRATTDTESRYSQIEIESAALAFAMQRNHIYLHGLQNFIASTDHKPLLPLYNQYKAELPARILRDKLKLQDYSYTLIHEPGKTNPADYLSRHPVVLADVCTVTKKSIEEDMLYIDAVVRANLPKAVTKEHMLKATLEDETLTVLKEMISQGYISKEQKRKLASYTHIFPELSVVDGLVLRGCRIVVPASLWQSVTTLAHEGHQGVVRTKQYLRMHLWFPGLDKRVETEIAQCMACQANTDIYQQEPLKPTELPTEPWSKLATDLYGPLDTGEYLLVVQCLYSRFPMVEIVRSTSGTAVIPAMDKILSTLGIPDEIASDNGPPYSSEEFKSYARYMGFEHKKKIPYAPWANGMAENFMKNLGKIIRSSTEERLNWRQELQKYLRAYRATPHTMTKHSPASLLFNGRRYKTRLPTPTSKKILLYDREVRTKDARSKETMKQNADSKSYVKELDIKVGDTVLCRQAKLNKKTTPFNNEPMIVVKRKGSLVTARNATRTITRHITFFKKLQRLDENKSRCEGDYTTQPLSPDTDEREENVIPPNEVPIERPVRIRQPPARYRDENFQTEF